MDPNVKKIVDAALAWTDSPTPKNAGAIKSAVRGYREAEKAKKKAPTKVVSTKKKKPTKKTSRKATTPDLPPASPDFDTSDVTNPDKPSAFDWVKDK